MSLSIGVVEDNKDPLKQGRVRVRILGVHSEIKIKSDTAGASTEELPWSQVMMPNTSASISGIGETSQILQGSWVVLAKLDETFNRIIILGTLQSNPTLSANVNIGFNDPDGVYPTIINEPDVNRLARNENISQTIVKTKSDNRFIDIPKADGSMWYEPKYIPQTVYPYNEVKETSSGHIIEFDNTDGHERIHEYHKSGTFYEIGSDGTKVTKIYGDNYRIVINNENVYISGDRSITVDGVSNVLIRGRSVVSVEGNADISVSGDSMLAVAGDAVVEASGDITQTANGDINIDAGGNVNITGTIINLN